MRVCRPAVHSSLSHSVQKRACVRALSVVTKTKQNKPKHTHTDTHTHIRSSPVFLCSFTRTVRARVCECVGAYFYQSICRGDSLTPAVVCFPGVYIHTPRALGFLHTHTRPWQNEKGQETSVVVVVVCIGVCVDTKSSARVIWSCGCWNAQQHAHKSPRRNIGEQSATIRNTHTHTHTREHSSSSNQMS